MPFLENIMPTIVGFTLCLLSTANITAQPCSGSWELQRPLNSTCFSGQWVGWQNIGTPSGCPVNPIYTGVQTNTYTFPYVVNSFDIDFTGFDGAQFCARLEVKINGSFYALNSSNISSIPGCTDGSASYVTLTPDGYLTVSALGGSGLSGTGRISINNVNALSVSVSTNDGSGTIFSNPFNCTIVPLTLENFTGISKDCKTVLKWKSGIEQNVKMIEVEKSVDGIVFLKDSEVLPKGSNSNYFYEAGNYSDAFFRLKIIDLDGSYQYSEILHIKSSCNKPTYQIYPNPAQDQVTIIGLDKDDRIRLTDITGRIISTYRFSQSNVFNIQNLSSSIYIIQVINTQSNKSAIKFIKK